MSNHQYKQGDKVTFAVSREHFVENVDCGKDIAEICFDPSGIATISRAFVGFERTGIDLVAESGCEAYLDGDEVNSCIKPYLEPATTHLTPQTDRERMLCDAVMTMERGIELVMRSSQNDDWQSFHDRVIVVDDGIEYLPAPKLPEIPWEWIDDGVAEVEIRSDLFIMRASDGFEVTYEVHPFKLDLTDVTLPVTVERPKGDK